MMGAMTARCSAEVTFTFTCFGCGVTEDLMYKVAPGSEFPYPSLPLGWVDLLGSAYCPKHKLSLVIYTDGERKELPLT